MSDHPDPQPASPESTDSHFQRDLMELINRYSQREREQHAGFHYRPIPLQTRGRWGRGIHGD